MTARLNPFTAAPEITQAFLAFSNQVGESGLEKPLLELVKIRASQINGCANCLNMHTCDKPSSRSSTSASSCSSCRASSSVSTWSPRGGRRHAIASASARRWRGPSI